ncbi:MAG: hypothetical protein CMJ58_23875 [Planctomycetaceae bacterium]|nr:hypothetical protein [Planctomycetaceae bacterium]
MQYPSTADSGILINSLVIETHAARLLADLSEGERGLLVRIMTAQDFGPEEVIVQQGSVTRNVWMVLAGECAVIKEPPIGSPAKPVSLAVLKPLDVFGEMTLLDPEPHVATVQATTDVRTLRLRGRDFDDLLDAQPRLACRLTCNLLRIVSDRLRSVDEQLTGCLDDHQLRQQRQSWQQLRERLGKLYAGSPA